MADIHRTKHVPESVSSYFEREFPSKAGHSHNYYHYEGSKGQRVYGNEVSKNGKFYHNATQATEKEYEKMNKKSSPARSKALEKNKEAGHKIASVVADQRAYEKRNPNSYSYPYWQAKALEEKYPKQTEAYGKKVGSKGKYFR